MLQRNDVGEHKMANKFTKAVDAFFKRIESTAFSCYLNRTVFKRQRKHGKKGEIVAES